MIECVELNYSTPKFGQTGVNIEISVAVSFVFYSRCEFRVKNFDTLYFIFKSMTYQ